MFRRMAGKGEISSAIKMVLERMEGAVKRRPKNLPNTEPTLVAVTKTKPVEMIVEAYNCGLRHFGENYAYELVEKAQDSKILEYCTEIKWHYIGQLQMKNAKKILALPNLYMVETINSEKNARQLNSAWERLSKPEKLKIMIQVNTSGEESKSGCPPEVAKDLVKFIQENCPHLELRGLMTIGAYGYDLSKGPNPDFLSLVRCKEKVVNSLGVNPEDIELSMGMSTDYEHAIELGSTNIRVGSTIFGAREPPKKQQVTDSNIKEKEQTSTEQTCVGDKSEPSSSVRDYVEEDRTMGEVEEEVRQMAVS